MITFKNIFKDKDGKLFHCEFTAKDKQEAAKKAYNNIDEMTQNGNVFEKTMRNTNGHWSITWLIKPTNLKKLDKAIDDLEKAIDD